MTTRTISQITDATAERVGPFKIRNVLPVRSLQQVDPFLLIHHMAPHTIQPGQDLRIPPHPHAGFEVVTYLLQGEFFHRDSKGHDQVAKGGDINWMTSGSGIVHSEGPTADFLKRGGAVELLQIWINLPASHKKLDASFRHYDSAETPVVETENASIKVLIGTYDGKRSPVSTHTPQFLYHITAKAGSIVNIPVESSYTSAVYLLDGSLQLLGETMKSGQLADMELNGNQIALKVLTDSSFVVFGGQPLKEKVVSYGPFVMNSSEEIHEAIDSYQAGKMGVLEY